MTVDEQIRMHKEAFDKAMVLLKITTNKDTTQAERFEIQDEIRLMNASLSSI